MINEIKQDTQTRMAKSIESLKNDFVKIRTGRAHTSLLDQVMVSYYGNDTPLSQVANVGVADSRTLTISPWEKSMMQPIEKAIMNSGLGLNPVTSGQIIRVPLPALTEERRRDLIKVVRGEAENSRVAVRNIRRDGNGQLKELHKEKEITEDDVRHGEDVIQKVTDKFIAEIDSILTAKEAELMEV